MTYIQKIVNHQEKLLMLVRPHWIYLVQAFFWLIVLIDIGILLDNAAQGFRSYANSTALEILEMHILGFTIFFALIGLGIFFTLFLEFISIEIGLTDHRVIYKKGLFFIQVEEIEFGDIRGEVVKHGFFGWILGYGRIHLDCRYVGDIEFPAIQNPHRFLRTMHKAKSHENGIDDDEDKFAPDLVKMGLNSNVKKLSDQGCKKHCDCAPKQDPKCAFTHVSATRLGASRS